MAATGDWITPRLWGAAWFEKPALLYWMTATGFKAGLGADWAPRLPVALASVAFLIYFFVVLRREFGERAAWYSATILATSAGWLAYSHVAITDLPMSAAFAAAMLVYYSILSARVSPRSRLYGRGSAWRRCSGWPCLQRGLSRWRSSSRRFGFCDIAFAIWRCVFGCGHSDRGALVRAGHLAQRQAVSGGIFLEASLRPIPEERAPASTARLVLRAGFAGGTVFPWTPLLALLFSPRLFRDRRAQFLLAWFAWGFVFFSVSRNKLPGYLLPLLPPLAALMGIALAEHAARPKSCWPLAASCCAWLPRLGTMLPQALAVGHFSRVVSSDRGRGCRGAGGRGMLRHRRIRPPRSRVAIVAALTTVAVVSMVWRVYPELDRQLSGRSAGINDLPAANEPFPALQHRLLCRPGPAGL